MVTENLRLERELGEGGMGAVWLATNLALNSPVAVKVMHACESAQLLRRFRAEARGLAQINSPHVVRVFDYGVYEDREPFIVMELLDGEDHHDRIERDGPLALDECRLIIRQLCHALSSAHERGVVHRDIKPANIFLTSAGDETFVKVLDFGVAKFAGPDLGMTSTGALMGTPYYASPEQLLDPKHIDHRADLWSVGVVAYACLTATLPFMAETLGALSVAIHEGHFEPPSSHREELPPAVDTWMQRALSREPADRFSSAQELSAAFAEALDAPRSSGAIAGASADALALTVASDAPGPLSNGKTVVLEDDESSHDSAAPDDEPAESDEPLVPPDDDLSPAVTAKSPFDAGSLAKSPVDARTLDATAGSPGSAELPMTRPKWPWIAGALSTAVAGMWAYQSREPQTAPPMNASTTPPAISATASVDAPATAPSSQPQPTPSATASTKPPSAPRQTTKPLSLPPRPAAPAPPPKPTSEVGRNLNEGT